MADEQLKIDKGVRWNPVGYTLEAAGDIKKGQRVMIGANGMVYPAEVVGSGGQFHTFKSDLSPERDAEITKAIENMKLTGPLVALSPSLEMITTEEHAERTGEATVYGPSLVSQFYPLWNARREMIERVKAGGDLTPEEKVVGYRKSLATPGFVFNTIASPTVTEEHAEQMNRVATFIPYSERDWVNEVFDRYGRRCRAVKLAHGFDASSFVVPSTCEVADGSGARLVAVRDFAIKGGPHSFAVVLYHPEWPEMTNRLHMDYHPMLFSVPERMNRALAGDTSIVKGAMFRTTAEIQKIVGGATPLCDALKETAAKIRQNTIAGLTDPVPTFEEFMEQAKGWREEAKKSKPFEGEPEPPVDPTHLEYAGIRMPIVPGTFRFHDGKQVVIEGAEMSTADETQPEPPTESWRDRPSQLF
jgi:hypothetical protein